MKKTDGSVLIEQLHWRYAVKKFDAAKKISAKDWETLEELLVLSPSSYGLQPWKFLVVQKPELRKQLTPVSWNQTQVEDCSHFIVFTSKEKVDEAYIDAYMSEIANSRKVAPETLTGYRNVAVGDLVKGPRSQIIEHWAARQTYIALGNLLTCAALLGIDACPMEGMDPMKYDEILKLKGTGYHTVVACALGYRSEADKYSQVAKVRFPKSKVLQYL